MSGGALGEKNMHLMKTLDDAVEDRDRDARVIDDRLRSAPTEAAAPHSISPKANGRTRCAT